MQSVRGLLIGASRSSGHRQTHCFDNPLDQPQDYFPITGWSVSSLKDRFFAALDSDNDEIPPFWGGMLLSRRMTGRFLSTGDLNLLVLLVSPLVGHTISLLLLLRLLLRLLLLGSVHQN